MIENSIQNLFIIFSYFIIYLGSLGFNFYEIPEKKVIRVIDGDTFEIYIDRKLEKVRMIGINNPESVDPKREIECYGMEASDKLKKLIQGKIVRIEQDNTQDDKDKFGRMLRYVFIDNENINKKMIKEGFAFEYTYKKPYKYQKEFQKEEMFSRENKVGMWSQENCNY